MTIPILVTIILFHITSTLSSVLPNASDPETCNLCCQGQPGLPGVPGSAGVPGFNGQPGRDGLRGELGLKGEPGERGFPGGRGLPGIQGPIGDRGERGLPGLSGSQGRPGVAGEPGQDGPKGEIGLPGPVGERGPQGPSGLQGPRGTPGLQGLPGSMGRMGIDGHPGAEGQPGPSGPKGSKGDSARELRKSAFSVFKTVAQTGNIGDVVVFQEEQTNVGSHYSMENHKFICQIAGTYVFMFTIATNSHNHDPYIMLVKDGAHINAAHIGSDQTTFESFHQASNMAIVQLDVGNKVWLQWVYFGGEEVYSDSYHFSSFSGFLLYADE